MVSLIDFDSILYTSVYRVVSIKEMREALSVMSKEDAIHWLNSEVYERGLERAENAISEIKSFLSESFFLDIDSWELYITTCKNNFRNNISSDYKANRKPNKYVWILREHYLNNGAFCSDTLEADDLIADRSKELGVDNCVVISIDKDLKQIGGFYWSYYKQKQKLSDGTYYINEYGNHEREFKQREVEFISKEEAEYNFYFQMLLGDSTDNIKGLKGVGKVRAEKMLKNSSNYFLTVARAYFSKGLKDQFKETFNLIKLGSSV